MLASRFFEEPLARLLTSVKLSPNSVTLLGLAAVSAAGYLAASGRFLPAGLVLLLASVMDMLDGAMARLSGRVTSFGAALDSIVDRLTEAIVLLGLLLFYLGEDDDAGAFLASVTIVASFMVSYIRARGEGLGVTMKESGLVTRTERVVVMVVGLLISQVRIALVVVLAMSVFTAGQRMFHLWRGTRE